MNPKERNRPRKHRSHVVDEIRKQMNSLALARTKKKLVIASKIAEALDKSAMKKIDLAALLAKEPSEVTRWTSGDHNFTVDILSDLEEVLGIQLLAPHTTTAKKGQPALECNLTVNIQAGHGTKLSSQDIARASHYITQAGGMQVTELKAFTKQMLD